MSDLLGPERHLRRVAAYKALLAWALTVDPDLAIHRDVSDLVGEIGSLLGFTLNERTVMLHSVAEDVGRSMR